MKKVSLYWNHICILHNYEKMFLEEVKQALLQYDIELNVTYFGMGYPEHMSEYLYKKDAVLPDIIVSADLEVFEDARIFSKLEPDLYPCHDWVSFKDSTALKLVERSPYLLPFISIPLVYFTTNPDDCKNKKMDEIHSLAFGGINNSAGKTVTKALWNRYGKEAAEHVLRNSIVEDMPIGAFRQVKTGKVQTALVPSIYALRADNTETFMQIPQEGPLLIPSYLCVRNSIEKEVAVTVVNHMICQKLCEFYATKGDLIVYPDFDVPPSQHESEIYFAVESRWLEQLSPQEFYDLYGTCLSKANTPNKKGCQI